MPPPIRANAYAAAESGGMIWMSTDATDAPPALPDLTPVISLAIEAAPATVLATLGSTDAAPVIAIPLAAETLHIGWHRVHATKTMLHATISGTADIAAATAHLRALRNSVEQGAAA